MEELRTQYNKPQIEINQHSDKKTGLNMEELWTQYNKLPQVEMNQHFLHTNSEDQAWRWSHRPEVLCEYLWVMLVRQKTIFWITKVPHHHYFEMALLYLKTQILKGFL